MAESRVQEPAIHPLLKDRHLYLCTSDRDDLAQFISACVAGGVDVVQLRDKGLEARDLTVRATLARSVCRDLGVPFIVNDRPDIALEVDADGVHVGQEDVSPSLCRRILGDDAIVGLSTHAPAELTEANNEPIDYVSVGPVTETPTKPGRPGTGMHYVRFASENTTRPFFTTGGVSPDQIAPLVSAGATRFVVVRFLTESPEPMEAARSLRHVIDEKLGII